MFHHFHSIVLQYADVVYTEFTHVLEQCANAGFVHFAAQEIILRSDFGDLYGCIPHAEPNF